MIRESDAVIGLIGGKGTRDVLQKAALARKPVFPIPLAGGGSEVEWETFRQQGYGNRHVGDLDFLGDRSIGSEELARRIVRHCTSLLLHSNSYSERVFIVHGHDTALRNELVLVLERLHLKPIVLSTQPDGGRTVLGKLSDELVDVGYAFVLLTPDDVARSSTSRKLLPRVRQNVIFEHGWLIGLLGTKRVCAIVKDAVEVPSDLAGVVYKHVPKGKGVEAIAVDIVRELRNAGYCVDANDLVAAPNSSQKLSRPGAGPAA